MFGISFTELLFIGAIALLVVGPKQLPKMLGTLGTWIGKLRRITTEMRQQTGIDEILREEGIKGGLNELRSLARGNVYRQAANYATSGGGAYSEDVGEDRSREYPVEGPDAYGALPDDLLDDEEEASADEANAVDAKPTQPSAIQESPAAVVAKPQTQKPIAATTPEAKPAETKPAETKPAETKPAETKPAETKPLAAPRPASLSGTAKTAPRPLGAPLTSRPPPPSTRGNSVPAPGPSKSSPSGRSVPPPPPSSRGKSLPPPEPASSPSPASSTSDTAKGQEEPIKP